MKKLLFAILLTFSVYVKGQIKIGNNPTVIYSSSILELESTTRGFLLPRLTTTERNSIINPATGLQIFNTTTNILEINTGTAATPVWSKILVDKGYNGKGSVGFGDIFPNTGISVINSSGNIASILPVTTTLGVVKATKITFTTSMPDTNYYINLNGGTTNTDNTENQFSVIGAVVYYFSNKTTTGFTIVAQEMYPDTQQSAVDFNFGY
jgi:hypothetical protein